MIDTALLKEYQERISSVILSIKSSKSEDRLIEPTISELEDLKNTINLLFSDSSCLEIMFTRNTDKPFFGIKINPLMNNGDALTILISDVKVKFNKYKLELDSKLFELDLTADELTSLIIYEISSIIENYDIIDDLRALLDMKLVTDDDVISIRDSINKGQLIIFAIKDTINKLANFLYKEDTDVLTHNVYIEALEMEEDIVSARAKVVSSVSGSSDMMRSARPSVLEWMLTVYKNMKTNSMVITDTLKDARSFTASKLDIEEINKTLAAVDRIDSEITFTNESLNKFFERKNISSLNEISIFKNLKKNGLRGIENELYEYTMRVKNCTDPDEATLIMRGINSRIGIIDDYISNEDLNDNDYRHWSEVSNDYRKLRGVLASKKLTNKSYGLFYRYDKLDDDDLN
jgi:hypothetical protein